MSKRYRVAGVIEATVTASSAREAANKVEEIVYRALDGHAKRLIAVSLGLDVVTDGIDLTDATNLLETEG